jgi:AraC family transcriptional regulator, glycine betaine-responsive activator
MFGADRDTLPQDIFLLLIPSFSMMAFSATVEPLRAANRMAGKELYTWRTLSRDGHPVAASNGISVIPDASIDEVSEPSGAVFVCAGLKTESYFDQKVFAWLRRVARKGASIGGVCTGAVILARAGLLDGYRSTIHWENMEGFVEEFPDHEITGRLIEIDRDRCTCSGGTAPLDLMLRLISADQGPELAAEVAEQMLYTFVRDPHEPQRLSLRYRAGATHPKLLAAVGKMESHLENPMSLDGIARSVQLSGRQLERLFQSRLGKSPSRYYLELRMRRAKLLLIQTSMPILEVAVACGFASASHFAKSYREFFGHSPRTERHLPLAPASRAPAGGQPAPPRSPSDGGDEARPAASVDAVKR